MIRALCCVSLLLCVSIVAADDPTKICGLEGFHLNDLYIGKYWNITVNEDDYGGDLCFRPDNDANAANCTISFAICKSLPDEFSSCGKNVSVCQHTEDDNGTVYTYNIGKHSTAEFLIGTDGFAAVQTAPRVPVEGCNGTINTFINFECNHTANYSTKQPNITKYLTTVARFGCTIQYTLQYSGACYIQPTLAPSNCQLDYYDVDTLVSKEYWEAEAPSGACKSNVTNCKFAFAFCHPLPFDLGKWCRNPESAVCQYNATNSLSMGAFVDYTRFYENVDADNVGFHVTYTNGSSNEMCVLETKVIFNCDKTAVWDQQDITKYISGVNVEDCSYTVMVKYDGACRKATPVHPNKKHSAKTSIVGWVLIGIFLFAILTYLVIGTAFQYFVRKERGIRVLPNYDFWANFVLLVLEGCKFSLDLITCSRFRATAPRRHVETKYDKI